MATESIPTLIHDLRSAKRLLRPDWEKRAAKAERLGQLRAVQAVGDLSAVAGENQNRVLCLAALGALGKIGNREAVEALGHLARHLPASDLQEEAIRALGEVAGRMSEEASAGHATATLVAGWETAGTAQCEAIRQAIVRLGSERSSAVLIAALGHPAQTVRDVAAKTLRQGSGAASRMVEALAHDDPRVRDGVRTALAQMEGQAVPELVAALGHANGGLREDATKLLGAVGGPAVSALIPVAAGSDARAAQAAAQALVQIGGPAVKPLLAASDAHPVLSGILVQMKKAVATALEDAPASDLPVLMAALHHSDGDIRATAISGLVYNEEQAVPLLMGVLRHEEGPAADAAAYALVDLGSIALDPLVDALADQQERTKAAGLLTRISRGHTQYIQRRQAELPDPSTERAVLHEMRDKVPTAIVMALGRPGVEETQAKAMVESLQQISGLDARGTADQLLARVIDDGAVLFLSAALTGEPEPGASWSANRVREALGEAESGLRGILHLDGDQALAHCWLGDVHRIRGLVPEAIAEHEEALRLGLPTEPKIAEPGWYVAALKAKEMAAQAGGRWASSPFSCPWEPDFRAQFTMVLGMMHMFLAEPQNLFRVLAERAQTNPELPPHIRDTAHYEPAARYLGEAANLGLVTGQLPAAQGVFDVEEHLGFCAYLGSASPLGRCNWSLAMSLLETSEAALERCLARRPESAKAIQTLAQVRTRLQHYRTLDSEALWQFERGMVLLEVQKQPDRAREALQAAIEAGLERQQGRVNDALESAMESEDKDVKQVAFEVAIDLAKAQLAGEPNDPGCHQGLAVLYAGAGMHQEAIPHFEQALELGADRAGVCGRLALAAQMALQALISGPEWDEVRSGEVVDLFRKAVTYGEEGLRQRPADEALDWVAQQRRVWDELGDPDRYAVALGWRLRGDWLDHESLMSGQIAEMAKKPGHGLTSSDTHLLAEIMEMESQNALNRAIAAFQETIRLKPDYAEARNRLASLYGRQGRYQEAVPVLQEGIRLSPDNWQLYFSLADIQADELDDPRAAIPNYQKGLALNPSWAPGHRSLGAAYGLTNQYSQAISSLQTALRLDPNDTGARPLLAVSYLSVGNATEGAREVMAVMREQPAIIEFYLGWLSGPGEKLLESLSDRGRGAEAMQLLNTLTAPLAAVPAGQVPRGTLARAFFLLTRGLQPLINDHDRLEGYDGTIWLMERGLGIESSDDIRSVLAETYSNKGRHFARQNRYSEGLVWAKKAIEVDGRNAEGWLTAFLCNSELGYRSEAMRCLEMAARLGHPQSAVLLRQMRGY